MEGLGTYIWNCRISEYCKKVFRSVSYYGHPDTNRIYASNKRKLINRCEKVGWWKMDEVRALRGFELRDYITDNEQLFEKLYKLEFGHSIFF